MLSWDVPCYIPRVRSACTWPYLFPVASGCCTIVHNSIVLMPGCFTQAQVCAAGALLNILGPELERSNLGASQRKGFGNLMAHILTLSIVCEALYAESLPASLLV